MENILAKNIKIESTIFREYDIRGTADVDPQELSEGKPPREINLTADQAFVIGKAFGTHIRRRGGETDSYDVELNVSAYDHTGAQGKESKAEGGGEAKGDKGDKPDAAPPAAQSGRPRSPTGEAQ